MPDLTKRYPRIQRVPSSDSDHDDDELLNMVKPFLEWTLSEIDLEAIELLLRNIRRKGNPRHTYGRVILTEHAVRTWINHQKGNLIRKRI